MNFTATQWANAPRFKSPEGSPPGIVTVDLTEMQKIAAQQEAKGAFRANSDGTMAMAPLFVDHLPSAFYKVDAHFPKFTPHHKSSKTETLVVVDGGLKISHTGLKSGVEDDNIPDVAFSGDVIELHSEAVAMQAVSLSITDKVGTLAIALYRDDDLILGLETLND